MKKCSYLGGCEKPIPTRLGIFGRLIWRDCDECRRRSVRIFLILCLFPGIGIPLIIYFATR